MRRSVLALLAAAVLTIPVPVNAQQQTTGAQTAQPGTVVVSYNKCALDAPAKLDSLSALAFYPVLDEMVREGRLLGWGVLAHAWGDEWNHVIYYSARDLPAFNTAWDELLRRVLQRRPTFMFEFTSLCTEHKDNIYGVMRIGAPPPPR